ncbi:MAG: nucleotidyltransferase domain-containing protein [bacterium]
MPYKIGLKEERRKRLEEELNRMLPLIIKSGVKKVILFGSLAKGVVHKGSDIDLVIVKDTKKRFLDRLDEYYSLLSPKVATDIFVYTPEEFEEMMKEGGFLHSALKEGKVLYEE